MIKIQKLTYQINLNKAYAYLGNNKYAFNKKNILKRKYIDERIYYKKGSS